MDEKNKRIPQTSKLENVEELFRTNQKLYNNNQSALSSKQQTKRTHQKINIEKALVQERRQPKGIRALTRH